MGVSSAHRFAAAVVLELALASCGVANRCEYGGRGVESAGYAAGEKPSACVYGAANDCMDRGVAGRPAPGEANRQPQSGPGQNVNPVLPYSTDDNNPNFPYDTNGTGRGGRM